LSYLLTGLLTEGTFTADAAAYGTADGVGLALCTEVHNSLNLLNLAQGPKGVPSRVPAVGGQWGAGARLGPVLTGTRTVKPCFERPPHTTPRPQVNPRQNLQDAPWGRNCLYASGKLPVTFRYASGNPADIFVKTKTATMALSRLTES